MCFVDLRKAFDSVPRAKLFYKLFKDYSIGGNFLKVLRETYKGNNVFVKLSQGLCDSFETTQGVLQGCVNSPILFNLFINDISGIFDYSYDPVSINNTKQSALLWADDLVLLSETAGGLQESINRMNNYFESLNLNIKAKKKQRF